MKKNLLVIALFVAMGMPMAHNLSGKDFGGAVSGLAKTNPMFLVSHVSGR